MRRTQAHMRSTGFTIVELVVVIVLLGILAVTVVPRIQTSAGIAEYGYQARLIASLRTMQQRAMNDTRDGFCFQVNVLADDDSSFGPPTLDYSAANQSSTCLTTIDSSNASAHVVASDSELASDNVSITSAAVSVAFNSVGCPNTGAGFCAQDVRVELSGVTTVGVCISSQGYIYACD